MTESCSCVYVDIDYYVDVITEKIVKSRKPHECCECRRVIDPGEQCEYTSYKHDSNFNTHRICLDCLSVRDEFFCGGWGYGRIWEDLEEHIDGIYGRIDSSCITGLTPAARKKVCEIIEHVWKDSDD